LGAQAPVDHVTALSAFAQHEA